MNQLGESLRHHHLFNPRYAGHVREDLLDDAWPVLGTQTYKTLERFLRPIPSLRKSDMGLPNE